MVINFISNKNMKKLLLYSFALLATFATFSCTDKDEASYEASSDRLMTPVFRTNRTISKGGSDPFLCQVVGRNAMQLYWSQVKGAKGYQIKASYEQSIANSPENWDDQTLLALDTILLGEEQDQLLLEDLMFSKTYRFAIRALSDRGEEHNSNWFGTGNLHQWTDMVYYDMLDKYRVPSIIAQKANITKESFDLVLDRSYDKSGERKYTADELEEMSEFFNTTTDASGNKVWRADRLVIEPASSNPDAKVPAQYQYPGLKLENSMFGADGIAMINVAGLDSNSVYNMYTYDELVFQEKAKKGLDKQKCLNYAQQNLDITVRTKGDPGEPIVIEPAPQDTMMYESDGSMLSINLPLKATSIQPLIEKFMDSNEYAENKVFYLRGGENYFVRGGLQVYKGFKLATHPDDIAAGKGRAKVFLYYPQVLDISGGSSPSPAFFMLSRNPIGSENPMITIDIDKFVLEDLDFTIPYVRNIGDGSKVVTNSYFMNMYSKGMGSTVEEISLKNCSFQGIVGGFYRVQANYGVRIKNFIIDNVDFYNGGYYSTSGRRYNWFHANPEANVNINIWENFVMKNCTIYDNPLGYMFNHNKQQTIEWPADLHYNITLENNTFINLNTCNAGNSMIFNTRWIPGGSTFTVKRNLFVLTRDDNDTERTMVQAGCDIRTINGSGTVTLDFEDNYSTNDNLTSGQIWSNTASAFDYTQKNTFGSLAKNYDVTWGKAGAEGLTVKVADISAKDLMVQPNPPHKLDPSTPNHYDHVCDGIDGTVTNVDKEIRSDYKSGMVDLHFKNFNNVLVEKSVGAPKWRKQ
jgi:hypothetical protein